MVNLTIDGTQVTVSKDATIYEAAKQAGVYIPVLCYAKKLLPYGACRVCLVEVEQMKGRLIPSCTTPVTEGMVVTTTSDEIVKVRKTVLEFLLVNHVVECPVCDKGGECDLQELTYEYEVVTNRFKGEKFDLSDAQRTFLLEAMKTLPREAGYDAEEYYDSYGKFLIYGDNKDPIPTDIKIYNKVGYAYGTLTDCAYIKDGEKGVEFMVTATILVNPNGVFNDNDYAYDEVGIPFLAALGEELYQIELNRKQ